MAMGVRTWKTKSGEIRRVWIVRYRDSAGNYKQKMFKSQRDADAWVAQINSETR